jgi:pyruvate-ferredoxin/flavodoxin oxidoreductase
METGLENQKEVVACGRFPLYRYNPELVAKGENPLKLDSKAPTMAFSEQALKENRFRVLQKMKPEQSAALMAAADKQAVAKYDLLSKLAGLEPCEG